MEQTFLATIILELSEYFKNDLNVIKNKIPHVCSTQGVLSDFHVTVYQCKIPQKSKDLLFESVKNIISQYNNFNLEISGINIKNNYIGIAYKKDKILENLHAVIVNTLNQLRGNLLRSTYTEKYASYSNEEKQNIDLYGYPYVFSEFRPHTALIQLKDANDLPVVEKILQDIKIDTECLISKISIIILDNTGKTYTSFSLK